MTDTAPSPKTDPQPMEIDSSTPSMDTLQTLIGATRKENPMRPEVFDSLQQATPLLKKECAKSFEKIQRLAERNLDNAEAVALVAPKQMETEFRCVCEYILVTAARHIFDQQVMSCKALNQGRVQYPFQLFGIQRLMVLNAHTPAGARKLFAEIHQQEPVKGENDGDIPEVELPPHLIGLATMMHKTVTFAARTFRHENFAPQAGVPNADPRMMLVILAPMTNDIAYSERPTILQAGTSEKEVQKDRFGRPLRCAVTNRLMMKGDAVRYFRMVFPHKLGDDEKAETRDYTVEAVLDHGLLTQRQQELAGTQVVPNKRTVSELAARLLTFARVAEWMRDETLPMVHKSVSMAQGVVSSEVLQGQRNKNKRRKASSASVLKKNKPDEFEEKVLAWHDFAYSPSGILGIIRLYENLKMMQIGFIRSYRDLGSVLITK